MKTIDEAKKYLRENFENGTRCPCCNQWVKLYRRKMGAGACMALIFMTRLTMSLPALHEGWIHVQQDFAKKLGRNAEAMDYVQLHRWGLIEPKPNTTDPTKKGSGMWRVTRKGFLFADNDINVPRYAYIYDNKTVKWSAERITIREAIKDKFDYEELMRITI